MKKKLQLNELKVQSFVTSETDQIKGGSVDTLKPTQASCLDYVSCAAIQCLITYHQNGACNMVDRSAARLC